MTVALGCIADDFTGATDLAGLIARSGAGVSLRIGIPDEAPEAAETAAFEVIALKSRTEPAQEAVDQARAALSWLRRAGAQRFFWKYCSTFDSTAKGNIGPVAEALMADLGIDQTIYCPAFPENGRRVFMGNLFVGQQPLAESPMKDHPLTPMRDSNLMRLLAPQVKRPVGLADITCIAPGAGELRQRLSRLRGEGVAHVIVDAVSDADLAAIAQACHDMPLITGGSAVAMPLPAIYMAQGMIGSHATLPEPARLPGGAVILSGSCSAMTRRQVEIALKTIPGYRLDPLVLAEHGPRAARAWLAAQDPGGTVILYASAEPEAVGAAQRELGVARAGEIVEAALSQLAIDARNRGTRRFVVAGGETSGAVTNALGVRRLTIGDEIAPSVPWTYGKSDGHDIALALKSGNFGAPSFFADALANPDQP